MAITPVIGQRRGGAGWGAVGRGSGRAVGEGEEKESAGDCKASPSPVR